jgi:DNA-binding NarL/FixJ family response regulator
MGKVRVLVADDQDIVRRGLAIIINQQPDMEVVAQAEDGDDAIRLARETQPDVVLMDIKMPRMNGIQATRVISSEMPNAHVVILTTYDVDDWVFEGIRAGARGYLLKETKADALAQVIRNVVKGESQLDPAIAGKVMEEFRRMSKELSPSVHVENTAEASLPLEKLTERETEVLTLIAQGNSNKVIAAKLVLSEGTVRNYVSTIMSKLQANDRAQVVVKAVQHRMVRID